METLFGYKHSCCILFRLLFILESMRSQCVTNYSMLKNKDLRWFSYSGRSLKCTLFQIILTPTPRTWKSLLCCIIDVFNPFIFYTTYPTGTQGAWSLFKKTCSTVWENTRVPKETRRQEKNMQTTMPLCLHINAFSQILC